MSSNHLHPNSPENIQENNYPETQNPAQFESDVKKLVRRHLKDKDHIITEEEIASIRVGMTPPQMDSENQDE